MLTPQFVQKLHNHFLQRHKDLVDKIRFLVSHETPSTDPSSIHAFLSAWIPHLEPLVDEINIIPGESSGPTLFLRVNGQDSKASPVLVLGHSDTVWPKGTLASFPFQIEGNIIRGPGVIDMKGGLAFLWEWLDWIKSSEIKPPRPVIGLITADEEMGSQEGKKWIEQWAPEAHHVVVPEPPGPQGELKIKRKGVAVYQFIFKGISAHAGVEPWKGASAILEAARAVEFVHGLNPQDYRSSFTVGVIKGGHRVNVVPDYCEFLVDVRYGSAEDRETYHRKMTQYTPGDSRINVEVSIKHERPPMEPSPKTLEMIETLDRLMQTLDYPLRTVETGGGSDGNFTAAMGIPTLDGMGPEGAHPHSREEFIRFDRLPHRMTLFALALLL